MPNDQLMQEMADRMKEVVTVKFSYTVCM